MARLTNPIGKKNRFAFNLNNDKNFKQRTWIILLQGPIDSEAKGIAYSIGAIIGIKMQFDRKLFYSAFSDREPTRHLPRSQCIYRG